MFLTYFIATLERDGIYVFNPLGTTLGYDDLVRWDPALTVGVVFAVQFTHPRESGLKQFNFSLPL